MSAETAVTTIVARNSESPRRACYHSDATKYMTAQPTDAAVRPALEPTSVHPAESPAVVFASPLGPAAAAASPAPGRVLFGIVPEDEVDELMQSGMASGGLVFGPPPPMGQSGKWEPSQRAPLLFSQPSNMQYLRRGTSVKRRAAEPSTPPMPPSAPLKSAQSPDHTPSPPTLSVPSAPSASTSRDTVVQPLSAQPRPTAAGAAELPQPPAVGPTSPLLPAAELTAPRAPTRPTQPPPSTAAGRPPTALALKPDGVPLSSRKLITTATSPPPASSPPQLPKPTTRSPQSQSTPAVTFSKDLKVPSHIAVTQLRDRPGKEAASLKAAGAAAAPAMASPSGETPSETPVPSSGAPSTAPTSPLMHSSPPTGLSPKPVLKPKSWADLVRPPNAVGSPSPTRKRVSIALPPSEPTSPTRAGPSKPLSPKTARQPLAQQTPPSSRSAAADPISTLSAVPTAPVQVPSQAPAVPPAPSQTATPAAPPQTPPPAAAGPPPKRKLEEILTSVETKQRAPLIQPRGLVNKGNQCFENSILQVLLFCGPMYNLLRLLGQHTTHDFSNRYPTLEAMIAFVDEFTLGRRGDPEQQSVYVPNAPHRPTITDAFAPEMVYDALKGNKRFDVMMRGSQEDAQEFLGFLLDTLHEELLALMDRYDTSTERPQPNGSAPHSRAGSAVSSANGRVADGEDDGWLEVGSKGRMATTRSADARESPMSRIFGGKQRSTLRVPGQKDSATVEPFLTLQLDIQPDSVETIEDALANMCLSDTVTDYTARPGVRVDASKQLSLESLPPVLVLHLKRFAYDPEAGGTIKNHKVVGFGTELEVDPAWVSTAGRRSLPIKYSLSAVVYHHGRQATGGHYTTSIRKQDGQWINIDDTTITDVGPADVAVDRTSEVLRLSLPSSFDGVPERSAYLLVWTRL